MSCLNDMEAIKRMENNVTAEMAGNKVFVVIGKDSHCDLQVELFSTFEFAKKYCDDWLAIVHGDIEESCVDGVSYNAYYGESDSVRIDLKSIDSK